MAVADTDYTKVHPKSDAIPNGSVVVVSFQPEEEDPVNRSLVLCIKAEGALYDIQTLDHVNGDFYLWKYFDPSFKTS